MFSCLPGTVRDNIAYGKPDASEEEIISAAKKANIHDTVMTMENGYDTYIGERGVKLSGGQKQRISIARAFLKNPPILILDEATSALDNATEMMIQKSLEQLSQNRTSIIVAHRLSTIKNADEIVVITDDGIKEQGTHQQLLDKGGIYAELYAYQFADLSPNKTSRKMKGLNLPPMKKAVIFDLDGTLANTLTTIAYFANQALEASGFQAISKEKYRYMVGNGAKIFGTAYAA